MNNYKLCTRLSITVLNTNIIIKYQYFTTNNHKLCTILVITVLNMSNLTK